MISLKTILAPTDFSDYGGCALDYACALAARFESELHLLHVVPDMVTYLPEPGFAIPAMDDNLEEVTASATKTLKEFPGNDWDTGQDIVRQVLHGTPFVEIVRYAQRTDIDLIVVSTHGRTGLKHALMGSVAERIVRKAPCPVLTVRPDGHQFVMP